MADPAPTRDVFLTNNLIPCPANSQEDCEICVLDITSPVSLPCGHIFCRECITQWIVGPPEHNTCPKCRVVLFHPQPIAELAQLPAVMSAAEHVAIVHQAAHRIRIRHSEGNGRYRHRFHDSRLETSDKLYRRALESAQAAIIEDQTETWASNDFAGPLTVRRGRMTPHVIAMGRLLRSHHLALGLHPLTLDERADWDHAVEMIWDALRAMRVDRWSGEFTDFYPEVRRRVNIAAAEFTARVTLGDPRGELLWARWLDITEAGLEYAGPPSWRACGHMTIMLITYLGRQCALQTRRDGEN